MKLLFTLLAGMLFGAGLAISGMTDPAKVIAFLDVAGAWDPRLAFVMGGALAVFGAGLLLLRRSGARPCGVDLPDTSADPVCKRMLIGSLLFGVGWGLGGFCPGPAIANLALLRTGALAFVPAMLVGMVVAQRVFDLDR